MKYLLRIVLAALAATSLYPQGYSVAEAARSLGLRDNLLRNWKQALEAQDPQAFPGPDKPPAVENEGKSA